MIEDPLLPLTILKKEKKKVKMKSEQQPDETAELSPILTTFDTSSSSPPPSLGHGVLPAAAGPAATHQQPHHQTYSSGGGKTAQSHWKSDTRNFRIQGWDPVLIISQILAIQALHYVILCLITPPMLTMFAKPGPLEYEGGARNVAMIMDWHAMAGSSTLHPVVPAIPGASRLDGWAGFGRLPNPLARNPLRLGNRRPTITLNSGRSSNNSIPDSAGLLHRLSLGLGPDWATQNLNYSARNSQLLSDNNRSWVISIAWLISSLIGSVLPSSSSIFSKAKAPWS